MNAYLVPLTPGFSFSAESLHSYAPVPLPPAFLALLSGLVVMLRARAGARI